MKEYKNKRSCIRSSARIFEIPAIDEMASRPIILRWYFTYMSPSNIVYPIDELAEFNTCKSSLKQRAPIRDIARNISKKISTYEIK